MIDYETIARDNHRSGMNCATAVYDALGIFDTVNLQGIRSFTESRIWATPLRLSNCKKRSILVCSFTSIV